MATVSGLLRGCLAQFASLISSTAVSDHTDEVPLHAWENELGRLREWAANTGAHKSLQSSLDFRLRDASHIRDHVLRLLERVQKLLAELDDVLKEEGNDESQDYEVFEEVEAILEIGTEVQEIYKSLVKTINQLNVMSTIICIPAQHDLVLGVQKQDAEPFRFWAKQHIFDKYPNADALAIDRISFAMARQKAILRYRERRHAESNQGVNLENNGKSTMLSETMASSLFKEMPGQFSDEESDTDVSETSYGGTLLDGSAADPPKIPPIPREGMEKRPFKCPYCFYFISVSDKKAWARHIFRDVMPYICIFPGCTAPNKLYQSRRQWYDHVQLSHSSAITTDGVYDLYDCSICKQGFLPTATFQQHVGKHLEDLALFYLPRLDSGRETVVAACE